VQAGQAEVLEGEVVLLRGQASSLTEPRQRNGEDPQSVRRGRLDLRHEFLTRARVEMAQVHDCFGRALGRNDIVAEVRRPPHVGQREQVLGQRVLTDELPVAVEVLGVGEIPVTDVTERPVHRVERVDR
jgi:hypothetical protein